MFKITRLLNTTLVAAILSILSACGSGDQNSTLGSSGFNNDCPPEPSSSLSALDRIGGIENLEKYSKWQTKLPPLNCAGALANYIPILPDGYGLPPMSRPPIMMDGHVYLRYIEIPEAKNGEPLETLNFAFQPQYEFEIAQLTADEAGKFRSWFRDNPKSWSEYPVDGRMFHATGGGALYMPGHKLMGGMATILENNVIIKFSMPKMYTDKKVPEPVARMFHEIALRNGQ